MERETHTETGRCVCMSMHVHTHACAHVCAHTQTQRESGGEKTHGGERRWLGQQMHMVGRSLVRGSEVPGQREEEEQPWWSSGTTCTQVPWKPLPADAGTIETVIH